MKPLNQNFPHLSRNITALGFIGLKIAFMLFLTLTAALNFFRTPSYDGAPADEMKAAAVAPHRPLNHILLGEALASYGDWQTAKQEYDIALRLNADSKDRVLAGLTLNLQNILSEWQNIRSEIQFWQEITEQKRDYRDGYLKLAGLFWRLGEMPQVQKYLQQAKQLDPNSQIAAKFEELLSSLAKPEI